MKRETHKLVSAVRANDGSGADAFAELVRRFQDMAFACAYAVLGEASLAEDAAQEAFLSAWQNVQTLRDPEAFPGWLRRIVSRESLRIRRRRRELPAERPQEGDDTVDPAERADRRLEERDRSARVWSALSALPEAQRIAVVLFYVRDHSHREIADFLSVPETTIKKRLHDARGRLRRTMIQMTKDHLRETRPSNSTSFETRVEAAMRAAVAGDANRIAALLADDGRLATARGPHPIWSGEPTPLHVAAERGHTAVVRALLEGGADPSGDNAGYDEWSPLMLAAYGGRLGQHPRREEIVSLLIERGAEIDVFAAALLGHTDLIATRVRGEPSLAVRRGPAGATALHFASDPEIARLLIQAGAEVDRRDDWGNTPLERMAIAGERGRAVARVLIGAGANYHACAAAALNDLEGVVDLLDGDPEALHRRQRVAASITGTPLHAAAQHAHLEMTRLLLERGADPNARADRGQTPLHCLAFRGGIEVAELLLGAGADLAAVDDDHGTTPLVWARFALDNLEREDRAVAALIDFLEARGSA